MTFTFWHWLVLGGLLLLLEVFTPGFVFMWLALAAAVTGRLVTARLTVTAAGPTVTTPKTAAAASATTTPRRWAWLSTWSSCCWLLIPAASNRQRRTASGISPSREGRKP